MNNPYEWLQGFIAQVPDILQPLIVALAGAIPYIEGEGAAAFGIIAGINPIVAAVAGATGNILCVVGVVVLGSRIRERVITRRAAETGTAPADARVGASSLVDSSDGTMSRARSAGATAVVLEQVANDADETNVKPTKRAKGQARLRGWMVRFGVPGASILAPLALPTMLTAAFFVASGVPKHWVILWQVVAIVLWTSAVALAATGVLGLLGW
jgi:hypothetical protein